MERINDSNSSRCGHSGSADATAARDAGAASFQGWSGGRSWYMTVTDDRWRTPEPEWGKTGRSYMDTHYFDPNTGASVSTRHRYRRSVAEMTEAMASAAPPASLGAGASDLAASVSRYAPMLAAQA